jgi:hypothetical protein
MTTVPIGSSRKVRLSTISQFASPAPHAQANAALNGVHNESRPIQWRASVLNGDPFA